MKIMLTLPSFGTKETASEAAVVRNKNRDRSLRSLECLAVESLAIWRKFDWHVAVGDEVASAPSQRTQLPVVLWQANWIPRGSTAGQVYPFEPRGAVCSS